MWKLQSEKINDHGGIYAFILSLVNQPFSWHDQPQFCKVPLTHTEYYTVGSEQLYCFDDLTL